MRHLLLLAVLGWAMGQSTGPKKPCNDGMWYEGREAWCSKPIGNDAQEKGYISIGGESGSQNSSSAVGITAPEYSGCSISAGTMPTFVICDKGHILVQCVGTGQYPNVVWESCKMEPKVTIEQVVQSIADEQIRQQKDWLEDRRHCEAGWNRSAKVARLFKDSYLQCVKSQLRGKAKVTIEELK